MRRITIWITAGLSALILGYSHYANLTGDGGKTGDRNPACALECRPGENK